MILPDGGWDEKVEAVADSYVHNHHTYVSPLPSKSLLTTSLSSKYWAAGWRRINDEQAPQILHDNNTYIHVQYPGPRYYRV